MKATQESPYGTIVSHWRTAGDRILYDVVVPPNSTALLELPVPPHTVRRPLPSTAETATRLVLEAGTHRFTFPW